MLVINNKYKFSGTIKEMYENFSIDSSCLCGLEIKEYTDCEAVILWLWNLQEL